MSNIEIIPVSSADMLVISPAASDEPSILGPFEALEFEFDEAVDKASRLDYGVAAGSGLLTGLLSVLLGKTLSVGEAAKIGGKEADKIVVDAARAFGCDLPSDKALFDKDGRCSTEVLAKAINFLEDMFPIPPGQAYSRVWRRPPTPPSRFFASSYRSRPLLFHPRPIYGHWLRH